MKSNTFRKKLNGGKVVFISCIFILIGVFFFVARIQNEKNIQWKGWEQYRNADLGFSFRYPKEWGDVKVDQGKNGELAGGKRLRGEYFSIFFTNSDYDKNAISVSAQTPDWEPWEHQIITWKSNEDARAYCSSYVGYSFILTHTGCDKFRDDIFTVNYAAYAPEGIASDPSTMTYEQAAFVKLVNKKFAGLEVRMTLGEQIDESFATKSEKEIHAIGSEQLAFFMQSRQDRINQFHQILSSFVVQ